jgi:hypothetical protein
MGWLGEEREREEESWREDRLGTFLGFANKAAGTAGVRGRVYDRIRSDE